MASYNTDLQKQPAPPPVTSTRIFFAHIKQNVELPSIRAVATSDSATAAAATSFAGPTKCECIVNPMLTRLGVDSHRYHYYASRGGANSDANTQFKYFDKDPHPYPPITQEQYEQMYSSSVAGSPPV
jgi:hypothetical protein